MYTLEFLSPNTVLAAGASSRAVAWKPNVFNVSALLADKYKLIVKTDYRGQMLTFDGVWHLGELFFQRLIPGNSEQGTPLWWSGYVMGRCILKKTSIRLMAV